METTPDSQDQLQMSNTQECADVVLSDFDNTLTSQNFLSNKDFLLQTQAIVQPKLIARHLSNLQIQSHHTNQSD